MSNKDYIIESVGNHSQHDIGLFFYEVDYSKLNQEQTDFVKQHLNNINPHLLFNDCINNNEEYSIEEYKLPLYKLLKDYNVLIRINDDPQEMPSRLNMNNIYWSWC